MPWHQRPMKGAAELRKVPGSCGASCYPGIPEWGNPARVMPGHPPLNQIGGVEGTQGTETSKYLQEEIFP